MGEDVFL